MKLAVIPARGGSKRIPGKNIKEFCGRPMLAWSIEAAQRSRCFDSIIVSTDDQHIAQVALRYGAEVPFLRSAELSDDFTGTLPVIASAVRWQQANGAAPTAVCCIYATAPFVSSDDLRHGFELLVSSGLDYAFAVTSYAFPIQRALKISAAGRVEMFSPEHSHSRSQDLVSAYHDAGQFYWGRADAWLAGRQIFSAASAPIILPRHRVQDIDTVEDWVRAELMFEAMRNFNQKSDTEATV